MSALVHGGVKREGAGRTEKEKQTEMNRDEEEKKKKPTRSGRGGEKEDNGGRADTSLRLLFNLCGETLPDISRCLQNETRH